MIQNLQPVHAKFAYGALAGMLLSAFSGTGLGASGPKPATPPHVATMQSAKGAPVRQTTGPTKQAKAFNPSGSTKGHRNPQAHHRNQAPASAHRPLTTLPPGAPDLGPDHTWVLRAWPFILCWHRSTWP